MSQYISTITAECLREALQKHLREHHRSLNSVAKSCGLTQPGLHFFLHGKRGLTQQSALKLKGELGLLERWPCRTHGERTLVGYIDMLHDAKDYILRELPGLEESEPETADLLRRQLDEDIEPKIEKAKRDLQSRYPMYGRQPVFSNGRKH